MANMTIAEQEFSRLIRSLGGCLDPAIRFSFEEYLLRNAMRRAILKGELQSCEATNTTKQPIADQ